MHAAGLLHFTGRRRLPVIYQAEAAECGLACLAMVAGYHGHQIDLNSLRRQYPVSLKGATLNTLISKAAALHFNTRPLRCELDELGKLVTPAILHWDMNHFVVLKSANRRIVIHDPARGERRLTADEASKSFTGVALELTPAHGFERKDELRKMRLGDFWVQARGLRRYLGHVLVLSLLLELFALASPFYMQLVVDQVIVAHDVSLLEVLALGFLLLAGINIAVSALRGYVTMYLGNMMSMQMASNLFRHLVRLPLPFFERRHIGDIVSRFSSMGHIKSLFTTGVVEALVDGVMVIGTLALMFIYASVLAWIVVGVVATYGLFRLMLYQPLRNLTHDSIVASAEEQSNFMETVRGMQAVKLFGAENDRHACWQNRLANELNTGIRVQKMGIGFAAANGLLFGLENVAVIYLGAKLVLDGVLTIGMLFAFAAYKGQFEGKAGALIDKLIAFKMLELHLHRIADIAHARIEPGVDGSMVDPRQLDGGMSLDGISFRYAESEPFVIEQANLSIAPGEAVAIVGVSGCGKSTLIKIMLGLLSPVCGEIRADGVDIHKRGVAAYRKQVAAVMQEDVLMSGSIAENICFFAVDRDNELMEQCARLAGVHREIVAMPMGYNSLIGDMGAALSGGQKQRLLLARALYRQPSILFLDEATSHVDVQLEQTIVAALQGLKITRVIVSHRPETIRFADRVVALQQGRLLDVSDRVLKARMTEGGP